MGSPSASQADVPPSRVSAFWYPGEMIAFTPISLSSREFQLSLLEGESHDPFRSPSEAACLHRDPVPNTDDRLCGDQYHHAVPADAADDVERLDDSLQPYRPGDALGDCQTLRWGDLRGRPARRNRAGPGLHAFRSAEDPAGPGPGAA